MNLINEIEVSYFRSFYKFKIRNLSDLNVIFGKNDSGKSNIVRALNLFFAGNPDHIQDFDFETDFCDFRRKESEESEDIRKFLYVKVTFNTPKSFQKSLGESFYVKRQWTVSRGIDYHEEISKSIPSNRRHIATRFLNKIRFIYIPAIKDISIFEMLLSEIHETLASAPAFKEAVNGFSSEVQNLTNAMFSTLPKDVSSNTKIGAPTQLSELFKTLDFETLGDGETDPKSLTRQRGDGIKARHIPELLKYISDNDSFEYHIWGFEEPENSLDFVAAQSEAKRILSLAKDSRIQIFMTTHSSSFYLLDDENISRFYVSKDEHKLSTVLQGRELEKLDPQQAIGEGFYLPAVAEALKDIAKIEERAQRAEERIKTLNRELQSISIPVVLTEGRTDAKILQTAWEKLYGDKDIPFKIRSCETSAGDTGSGNGGAQSLAVCLKGVAADHPHTVVGLFDYDDAGIREHKIDRNFADVEINEKSVRRGINGKAYAALLPAPSFRSDCEKYKNMPIEYLFEDDFLNIKVDEKGLDLKLKQASLKLGDEMIRLNLDDHTHFKEVSGSKSYFADTVVPTFPKEAFKGFEGVFALLIAIIEHQKASPLQ
ncbi:hypothetical protein A6U87_16100 [Rhizobium sp. AC44/96]|uniref:ATP-dependent nuclease n=1 Tax=Rhizobium sp. AC44/96 TaxID=1841654 RepID=UPI00080FAC62|nr:AAA family ATPase [Rhizobium sp. AC44/96]OCJ04357.1 hypothetical protein A6U87_16100 [Rhizobium sp. AC44/96]